MTVFIEEQTRISRKAQEPRNKPRHIYQLIFDIVAKTVQLKKDIVFNRVTRTIRYL